MTRKPYPSDLNNDEWELIEQLIPSYKGIGHPQTVERREIVNAILYWADNGIKWRAMPHDLPSWSTVYDYYRSWTRTGIWEQINQRLLKTIRKIEGRDEEPSLVIIDSQSVKTVEKSGCDPQPLSGQSPTEASLPSPKDGLREALWTLGLTPRSRKGKAFQSSKDDDLPHSWLRRKGTRTKQGLEQGIDGNKKIKGRKRHIVVDTQGLLLNCFVSAANKRGCQRSKGSTSPCTRRYGQN